MNKNASILFFSLNPEKEAVRKQWTKSKKVNLRIAKILYSKTLSKVKASKLDYYIISNHDSEDNFGVNIAKAIQQLFNQGLENLIVIGNDCPDVSSQDLLKANQELRSGRHSIGQTADGGSYLFTIKKDQWNFEAFKNLSWCTKALGQELVQFLKSQCPVSKLKVKADLNFLKDIQHYIIHANTCLSNLLKGYFLNFIIVIFLHHSDVSSLLTIQQRGPPTFLL